MCGVGTILSDDSLLTCRLPDSRNPVRIICDSRLRTPPDSRVVTTCSQARTILATCCTDREAWLPYEERGCEILLLPPREGRVDLNVLTERLGQMGIDSVLLAVSYTHLDVYKRQTLAIGYPVALLARADERLTRGFTSITQYSKLSGFRAY